MRPFSQIRPAKYVRAHGLIARFFDRWYKYMHACACACARAVSLPNFTLNFLPLTHKCIRYIQYLYRSINPPLCVWISVLQIINQFPHTNTPIFHQIFTFHPNFLICSYPTTDTTISHHNITNVAPSLFSQLISYTFYSHFCPSHVRRACTHTHTHTYIVCRSGYYRSR